MGAIPPFYGLLRDVLEEQYLLEDPSKAESAFYIPCSHQVSEKFLHDKNQTTIKGLFTNFDRYNIETESIEVEEKIRSDEENERIKSLKQLSEKIEKLSKTPLTPSEICKENITLYQENCHNANIFKTKCSVCEASALCIISNLAMKKLRNICTWKNLHSQHPEIAPIKYYSEFAPFILGKSGKFKPEEYQKEKDVESIILKSVTPESSLSSLKFYVKINTDKFPLKGSSTLTFILTFNDLLYKEKFSEYLLSKKISLINNPKNSQEIWISEKNYHKVENNIKNIKSVFRNIPRAWGSVMVLNSFPNEVISDISKILRDPSSIMLLKKINVSISPRKIPELERVSISLEQPPEEISCHRFILENFKEEGSEKEISCSRFLSESLYPLSKGTPQIEGHSSQREESQNSSQMESLNLDSDFNLCSTPRKRKQSFIERGSPSKKEEEPSVENSNKEKQTPKKDDCCIM